MGGKHDMLGGEAGSPPGSRATTLRVATAGVSLATVAVSRGRSAKPGMGCEASAKAASAAKLRPDPANSRSAAAWLKKALRNGVRTWRSAGSAGYIPGVPAMRDWLAKGCAFCRGVSSWIRPDRAARRELPRPLGPGMGFERAGQRRRPARDRHRDLAVEVDAGEIVMPGIGQMQTIADEDERRRRRAGGGGPPVTRKIDVAGDGERGVAQRGPGPLGQDPALLERHRLEVGAVLVRPAPARSRRAAPRHNPTRGDAPRCPPRGLPSRRTQASRHAPTRPPRGRRPVRRRGGRG